MFYKLHNGFSEFGIKEDLYSKMYLLNSSGDVYS